MSIILNTFTEINGSSKELEYDDPEEENTETEGNRSLIRFDKIFSLDEEAEMGEFIKSALKSILNECIDQLYILRNINSQNKADYGIPVLEYVSIEDRYMGSEDHAEYRINSVISSYAKLAKDINMLICILKETSDEISSGGTFSLLQNSTGAIIKMHEEETQLLDDYKRNQKALKVLRSLREAERLENIRTMEETNANIQKLRFEVEDVLVYGKYEVGYFEDWEKTRREQNTIVCEDKENVPGFIISDTKNRIDIENRCHVELENYIEESKTDYLDEIQYWMKHYDDETERREAEMLNLRADMEKLVEDHSVLKKKAESRQAEIDDWLEYKRLKREKEEQERLELWAAITIQSWWRGTRVRRFMGPYAYLKKLFKKKKKGKKGRK